MRAMMAQTTGFRFDRAKKIVLIDDDVDLRPAVTEALVQHGYRVYTALSCKEGMEHIVKIRPDLVVVDAALAGANGREGCRRIREMTSAPVLVLAAPGSEEELLRGLQDGADDYLIKPFGFDELLARMRVLLLRSSLAAVEESSATYGDKYLTVDLADRRVTVMGNLVRLTPTEYRLLGYLLRNAGRAVSYEELLEAVWGPEHADKVGYARIYAWRLRKRIERDAEQPEYILTEHGVGYRFEKARTVHGR